MIHTVDPPRLVPSNGRLILANRKVTISCGCCCWVGALAPWLRKRAVCSEACSVEHQGVVARFRTMYSDAKIDPAFADIAIDSFLARAHAQYVARDSVERAGMA